MSAPVWTGVVIAESLRPGAAVRGVPFTVTAVERVEPDNVSHEQRERGIPAIWTLLHVEVGDEDASRLGDALAAALDGFGWYADLRSDTETIVAFPGRVFRYSRGDPSARDEAIAYGRVLGIPQAQLDWPV